MRKLEGGDENSKIAEFIKQLKEKDALIIERDTKLEELASRNNLLDEEKADLRKQLARTERRQTISRGTFNSQKTRSRAAPNESFEVGTPGMTGASVAELDAAKAEITKVKDQNSDLKS